MKSTTKRTGRLHEVIAAHAGVRAAINAVEAEARREKAIEVLRDYESRQARKQRGQCSNCGHTWRPRNPSINVNRCPGCNVRGTVSYSQIAD